MAWHLLPVTCPGQVRIFQPFHRILLPACIKPLWTYHEDMDSPIFVRAGTLDDKRAGERHFAPLADFLESIPTMCPHDLFQRDDDPKARASQAHPEFADISRIVVNTKRNAATETAALIIPAVGNNKLRHETLQRFMLANDSVTVAIEVPIWLTANGISELEQSIASSSRRVMRQRRSPRSLDTSISCKCAMAPCTSLTTSPMPAPTSRSRN